MSMGIRRSASPLPRATATTATITVSGRLMAKTMGFIGSVSLRGGRPGRGRSERPVGLGVEVDDASLGHRRDLRPEIRLVGSLVARVAHREALLVDRRKR